MTGRIRTQDKQLTVENAVKFGVSSDIAIFTATGSDCTGDNRVKYVLREDKELLSCVETVRFIVEEGRGIW
jgi:hypothetical protein